MYNLKSFIKILIRKRRKVNSNKIIISKGEECMAAARLFKEKKELLGISNLDISSKTLISITVIEAIENGWVDKLPERAYLKPMLYILERYINLTPGSLNGLIVNKSESIKGAILPSFNPAGIDLFKTWKGNIIYIVFLLISIYYLNFIQAKITNKNGISINPISLNEDFYKDIELKSRSIKVKNPKDKNISRLSFEILNNIIPQAKEGLLFMDLSPKSKILIEMRNKNVIEINDINGTIKMKLRKPLSIILKPKKSQKDIVLWDGEEYF